MVRVRVRVRKDGLAAAARQVKNPQARSVPAVPQVLLCVTGHIAAQQQASPLAEREGECRRELWLVWVAVAVAVCLVEGRWAELAWLGLG